MKLPTTHDRPVTSPACRASSRRAEGAAGVVDVEVARDRSRGPPSARRQRVADDERDRGRGRRHQVPRIGLAVDADVDDRVGRSTQR